MPRNAKSATGEVANKRISFAVTELLYEKILALADINTEGNVSCYITELLEHAVEINDSIISENLKAKKDYKSVNAMLKKKYKNPLAQDSPPNFINEEINNYES